MSKSILVGDEVYELIKTLSSGKDLKATAEKLITVGVKRLAALEKYSEAKAKPKKGKKTKVSKPKKKKVKKTQKVKKEKAPKASKSKKEKAPKTPKPKKEPKKEPKPKKEKVSKVKTPTDVVEESKPVDIEIKTSDVGVAHAPGFE